MKKLMKIIQFLIIGIKGLLQNWILPNLYGLNLFFSSLGESSL